MAHGGHPDAGEDGPMLYDDSAFELFAVGFLAAVWIPTALFKIGKAIGRARAPPPTAFEKAKKEWCVCAACQRRKSAAEARTRPRFGVKVGNIAFVFFGVVLALGAFRVYRAGLAAEKPFDPFEILGVTEAATKAEIKKSYRKMAVIYHPDKNLDDPDKAAREFIRVSKAYAALTDEAAYENYKKYGNPDGYVGTTLGVGLPSFVENNNTLMLVVYLALLVVFPAIVLIWWRRQSQILPTSVMTDTFLLYRETIANTQKFKDLLGAIGGSYEFRDLFRLENTEHTPEITGGLRRAGKDDLKRVKCVKEPEPFQIQNLVVLSAYLARIPIPAPMQYVLDGILSRAELMLTAMTDTVGAFQRPDCQKAWEGTFMHGHTTHLQTCITLSQCVIQAMDKGDSPLLQIPGFTEREVRFCTGSRTTPARTVYEFMRLESPLQRSLLRSFTDEQFLDVQAFCDRYPMAMLTLEEPKVEDEEDSTVHARDSVTVRAKLTVMRRAGSVYSPHTPNLPGHKAEVWWVSLADQRLMCPIDVKRLLPKDARGHSPDSKRKPSGDSCCGGVTLAADGARTEDASCGKDSGESHVNELAKDPRVTVYDLVFRFTAPRAGSYVLELTAAVDCYVGCNKSKTVRMDVSEPLEPDTSGAQRYFDTDDESDYDPDASDEDSEEDEDGSQRPDGARTDPEDDSYEYIEVSASGSDSDSDEAAPNKVEDAGSDGSCDFDDEQPADNGAGNKKAAGVSSKTRAPNGRLPSRNR